MPVPKTYTARANTSRTDAFFPRNSTVKALNTYFFLLFEKGNSVTDIPATRIFPTTATIPTPSVVVITMWNDSTWATFLFFVCGLLMRPSHCSSPATNVTATAAATRRKFACYQYRPPPPALDMTAPVMDCARALLQFPKNAPPGESV